MPRKKRGPRKEGRLQLAWCPKEKDLVVWTPLGVGGNSTGGYVMSTFTAERQPSRFAPFNMPWDPSFIKEMEARGFDITTLMFTIDKKVTS